MAPSPFRAGQRVLCPGESRKEDKRGLGKYRQEVAAGNKRKNGIAWCI